jgi:hypothetical protein
LAGGSGGGAGGNGGVVILGYKTKSGTSVPTVSGGAAGAIGTGAGGGVQENGSLGTAGSVGVIIEFGI